MAQEEHPCARRHPGPHLFHDRCRARDGQGDRLADEARPAPGADEAPRPVAGAVFVVGRQHLVAGAQRQRAGDEVDAVGGVRHEQQVGGLRAQGSGERHAGRGEPRWQPSAEERDRLGLELALPALPRPVDRARAGAEAAVVEEGDVAPQHERGGEFRERQGERGHRTAFRDYTAAARQPGDGWTTPRRSYHIP